MGKVKRRIPVFKMSIIPNMDYSQLNNIPGVKDLVINELLIAIKEGISNKRKSISLFTLVNTDYYIELQKNQWVNSLNAALKHYESIEDYNKCIECRDLIKEISYEQSRRTCSQN